MATKSRMAQRANIASVDPIWAELRQEAEEAVRNEPALGGFIYATILSQDRLEDAVCHRLAQRLNHSDVDAGLIGHEMFIARVEQMLQCRNSPSPASEYHCASGCCVCVAADSAPGWPSRPPSRRRASGRSRRTSS